MESIIVGLMAIVSSYFFLKDDDTAGKLHGTFGLVLGTLLVIYGIFGN